MAITLYTNEGFTGQGERLAPVQTANGDELLQKLFEITATGKTVTIIRDGDDGCNYMLTIRNKTEHRKYLAELLTEITANFKLTIP